MAIHMLALEHRLQSPNFSANFSDAKIAYGNRIGIPYFNIPYDSQNARLKTRELEKTLGFPYKCLGASKKGLIFTRISLNDGQGANKMYGSSHLFDSLESLLQIIHDLNANRQLRPRLKRSITTNF
jgi:hypothetical protein